MKNKKKNQFNLLDQINLDQSKEVKVKELNSAELVTDFSEEEIKDYTAYNEKVTELDPVYSSLTPLHKNVILRLIVKDFNKKRDDVLVYSKNDVIPVQSGVNKEIIYMSVPSPYPFTKKAVVVSVNKFCELVPGDLVSLKEKLQIGFKSQDQGYVSVQGGFVHPDNEEDYDNMPEDSKDQHFGYVMLSEDAINLKLN
jgi:hypothetical protein